MDANKRRMYRTLICHGRERDGEPVTTPEQRQHRKEIHFLMMMFGTVILLLVSAILILALWAIPARAHDHDPVVSKWMQTLMQPGTKTPCCGESDAYHADIVRVRNGKVYAVITDDRPDTPLGRHHVPVGTEIEVPLERYKHDEGNPTGHTIIFLNVNNQPLCYVQGSGI